MRTKAKQEYSVRDNPRDILGKEFKVEGEEGDEGEEKPYPQSYRGTRNEFLGTKDYLDSRVNEIDQALVEACKSHNAQALKIAYQIMGKIKEDGAVKVKASIDGKDFAKELLIARRELEKEGMAQVQSKSKLLHNEVREDTGQGEHVDGAVPDVGIPGEVVTGLLGQPADDNTQGETTRD
jgi:hypothetical protein